MELSGRCAISAVCGGPHLFSRIAAIGLMLESDLLQILKTQLLMQYLAL
jgi:hypothetical protein